MLKICFPGVGSSDKIPSLSSTTINMKRIYDVLSRGADTPNCVHKPHSYVTPAHVSSSVCWDFTDIPTTATIMREDNDSDARMSAGADD